jgi:IS30 family transposase
MDYQEYTTKHQKSKHLTYEERVIIQIRLKDGYSTNKIAAEISCAPNTVRNEIRRGTVLLYGGKVERYKASAGQKEYEKRRENSRSTYKCLENRKFIGYVVKQFREKGWSFDACFGYALKENIFNRKDMVCTKTLYRYADMGLFEIRNIDLPEKLRRNTKCSAVRENRKKLGKSIEERPDSVNSRVEFGHWEIDTVIGVKDKTDKALLTLTERQSRAVLIREINGRSAPAVMLAIEDLKLEYGSKFKEVFKTITSDNGSEFAELSKFEKDGTLIYFTHPYTSCERGTNERHNGMIRRLIPKSRRIDGYTIEDIAFIEDWCNGLPRKILGYRTPEEFLDEQLDKIFSA